MCQFEFFFASHLSLFCRCLSYSALLDWILVGVLIGIRGSMSVTWRWCRSTRDAKDECELIHGCLVCASTKSAC